MSAKQAKALRKKMRKAYEKEKEMMLGRVLSDIEDNQEFALHMHYNSINKLSTFRKRLLASVSHAWRLIDRSPVIRLKGQKNGN